MILETISVQEASERLGVHITSVYEAIHSESPKLRGIRCGKQWRVLLEDVENYHPRAYPRGKEAEK